MGTKRVLLIEDDEHLAKVVEITLSREGFEVFTARDGDLGLRRAYEQHPDLVILDVMLPGLDGWEVCRRLKQMSNTPVLMLTARATEEDVLQGFDSGADDYVRKPFSLAELAARVKALLKRAELYGATSTQGNVLHNGDLQVDLARHQVTKGGVPVELTPLEFRLLSYFLQNPGRLLTHSELLTHVWGPEFSDEDQYLRLYVSYLRQKLQDDSANPSYIFNVRGEGYRFRES
ncbi:MAG: response regulator transcription factor [Anaerolineae bacterium]|nr:response regulator transcription factor [Anaerolineae bacterium]